MGQYFTSCMAIWGRGPFLSLELKLQQAHLSPAKKWGLRRLSRTLAQTQTLRARIFIDKSFPERRRYEIRAVLEFTRASGLIKRSPELLISKPRFSHIC